MIETYFYPGHLIRRLHQIATHAFMLRVKEAGFDLTPIQLAAMQALKVNPGIEQAKIANLIAYDRATIGEVVKRLEKKGYVTKVVSPLDRRANEVSLSNTGIQAVEHLRLTVRTLQDEILEHLSVEERAVFISMAQKASGLHPLGSSDSVSL